MVRLAVLFLFVPAPCPAAWIVYTNDTKATIILQDVAIVKGKPVAGKPVKLVAGETLRVFQGGPVTLTVQVLEPGKVANKLLSQNEVAVKDQDLALSIRSVGGTVKLVEPNAVKVKQ